MGFDVVIVEMISDVGFQAMGINNGAKHPDVFTGVEHSLSRSLDLARGNSNDSKVWLTETAFTEVSSIINEVYTKCHGIVTDSGYYYCNEPRWHEYECYFDETSITREFCEHGEKKYDYCADGSRVDTNICIPPDRYDTKSNCEECTVSGGRTKICTEATGDLPAGSEIVTHRCVDGKWVEVARCGEDAECYGEGDEKKITCDDGTEIVTHTCVNWKWVETGNHCPGAGGGTCVAGDVHTTTCDDGTEIVTERCIGGEWVGTGNTCPDAGGCTSDVTEICPDGSSITTKRCDEGTLVDTGATCPEKKDKGIMAIMAGIIGLYLYLRG